MSKYTMYYNSRQTAYKSMAQTWSKFAENWELTDSQKRGMAVFFRQIGKRFGLMKEFKEIGVI